MPGSGARKLAQALAIRAAKLHAQSWTARNIAEALGKRPEQIKAMIILGERLMQAKTEDGDD